ncbi:uncharacterized protein L969DRAFT_90466 [Mixia osmundae IAM 14324]|uniref:ENTH domain-containing protein n=1 Tax=Mixia osmundae (strain CBS 9802 / IAM 14324 / JCM 22182 / KY 12970) TaxID=764103 RepID=G7E2I9_MIXOS|nr:uncharacterized protein L969DRAFT_90466 [Mixia osmundae IAM 14324]KEI36921.1 hypothetical protein L969DRAFT_90466 [Mixia osmundae IAM 14324]GAA97049.1 hypothetical protein E5Q_03724 [Mixia osmundae IAM 14324]
MDFIESLAKQASQITMYDVKSMYNQAKNVVLNYTEMEAKVREATNDDPWGASSTSMTEIAQATNDYALFNEIMPTIYSRFTEKEAHQWRQIYKALQLLEYLVKHGSERVVDDARTHVAMIKILRNFHYIDEKGKDQGINVRNRSKELADLLSDIDRVRQERRKARAAKTKYAGTGNSSNGPSFTTASGSKYGGFGSDSYTGPSSSRWDEPVTHSYNDAASTAKRQDKDWEEYDEGEDDRAPARSSSTHTTTTAAKAKTATPAKPAPVKEVDLFDFGDDEPAPALAPAAAATIADDDFDDFQSAPVSPPVPAAMPAPAQPQAASRPQAAKPTFFDMMNQSPVKSQPAAASPAPTMTPLRASPASAVSPLPAQQRAQSALAPQPMMQPMTARPSTAAPMTAKPNYMAAAAPMPSYGNGAPTYRSSSQLQATAQASLPASTKADAFDDLLDFMGSSSKKPTGSNQTSMASLAAQKSSSSIWQSSGGSTGNNSSLF